MADHLKWGILATGGIAKQFAGGLKASRTGELVAVGSRTQESASAFTENFGGTPYGSYDAVLADPNVEAVYIALPHHLHSEWTIKCAEAGKAILCEKPFTLDAPEAVRALDVVRAKGVFFMEAFMYRCSPQMIKLRELLAENAIGDVLQINAEFGFAVGRDWQNFRTVGALGGGGLMDVGSYCISFARMVAGGEPTNAAYFAELTDSGYDAQGSGALKFANGITAHFGTGVHAGLKNDARVYGTEGWIEVESAWKSYPGSKMIVHRNGKDDEVFDLGITNDQLYGTEADAVAEFLEAKECPYVTIEDTLAQMRTIDKLKVTAGLVFTGQE